MDANGDAKQVRVCRWLYKWFVTGSLGFLVVEMPC